MRKPWASTQPVLKSIDLHYQVYLARLEWHVVVSPTGRISSIKTTNKSYRPNDSAGPSHIEIREGQITPQQVIELAGLFEGFESFDGSYAAVPDGPEIELVYGDRKIVGGNFPKNLRAAERRVEQLAESMPLVGS